MGQLRAHPERPRHIAGLEAGGSTGALDIFSGGYVYGVGVEISDAADRAVTTNAVLGRKICCTV